MASTSIAGREVAIGEPWFDDGNIILVTEDVPTAFRLHRGILARHSDIFRDMFEVARPVSIMQDTSGAGACPTVTMYDNPTDLSNLIKALYDGPKFKNRNVNDFCDLAGILRLATKYFIAHIRSRAIRFLTQTWSYTLEGHDEMVATALSAPLLNDTTYPYVHPLHILNLARETNVNIVIPSAMYFLSIYPLADLLNANHPKLMVEHPSRPASKLNPFDIQAYTLMYQYRTQTTLDFIRVFCADMVTSTPCGDTSSCGRAFSRLVSQLHRYWSLKTGPLHYITRVLEQVIVDPAICEICRTVFEIKAHQSRRNTWTALPGVIQLPPWGDMEREEPLT